LAGQPIGYVQCTRPLASGAIGRVGCVLAPSYKCRKMSCNRHLANYGLGASRVSVSIN